MALAVLALTAGSARAQMVVWQGFPCTHYVCGTVNDYTGPEYANFSSLYGKIGFLTKLPGIGCLSSATIRICETTPAVYHLMSVAKFPTGTTVKLSVVNGDKEMVRGVPYIIK